MYEVKIGHKGVTMAGRPKKPKKTKIIQGTFRKDREPEAPDPPAIETAPRPPSHLGKFGKRLWKSLARELIEKHILTVLDLIALEVLCANYDTFRMAHEAVFFRIDVDPVTKRRRRKRRSLGEYLAGKSSQTIPEFIAMKTAYSNFKSFLIEFGLTPASRGRIDIPDPKPEELDPIEKMWNEGRSKT